MNQYQNVSPLLITGANGSLGKAFARICDKRGIVYYLTNRNQLDIASEESVRAMLEKLNPWAVINAAGFTRIDEAEEFRIQCTRENITGPVILAKVCKKMDIKFITFSTDQVFNGKKRKPYSVADLTAPLNFYGLSKKLAEQKIRKINPQSLIIRSSFFFNPWHKEDHLYKMLESLGEKHFYLPSDIVHSPVYVPDFVNVVLDLLIDGETGIWHLSSQEEISHYDFARMALDLAGIKENILPAVPCSQLEYMAIRPPYSALKSSYGITLPSLGYALNNFLIELKKESLVLH
jgi:dTDP-4-dehydrorhamnose reductase